MLKLEKNQKDTERKELEKNNKLTKMNIAKAEHKKRLDKMSRNTKLTKLMIGLGQMCVFFVFVYFQIN